MGSEEMHTLTLLLLQLWRLLFSQPSLCKWR